MSTNFLASTEKNKLMTREKLQAVQQSTNLCQHATRLHQLRSSPWRLRCLIGLFLVSRGPSSGVLWFSDLPQRKTTRGVAPHRTARQRNASRCERTSTCLNIPLLLRPTPNSAYFSLMSTRINYRMMLKQQSPLWGLGRHS